MGADGSGGEGGESSEEVPDKITEGFGESERHNHVTFCNLNCHCRKSKNLFCTKILTIKSL